MPTGREITKAESLFDLKVVSDAQTTWQKGGSFVQATKTSLLHNEPTDAKNMIWIVREGYNNHPIPDIRCGAMVLLLHVR